MCIYSVKTLRPIRPGATPCLYPRESVPGTSRQTGATMESLTGPRILHIHIV